MTESPLVSNEGEARPGLFRAGFVGLENGFVAGWPVPLCVLKTSSRFYLALESAKLAR
jgi:hypothetical protein